MSENASNRELLSEGFKQITESEGTRYYFNKGEGNTIRGLLKGRYLRPKPAHSREPDQYFYEVLLTRPCDTVTRSEMTETGETDLTDDVTAEPGCIVRVDETQRLSQVIHPLLESDSRYEVVIECVGKMKLKAGKTFWRMNAYARKISDSEAAKLESQEVPF